MVSALDRAAMIADQCLELALPPKISGFRGPIGGQHLRGAESRVKVHASIDVESLIRNASPHSIANSSRYFSLLVQDGLTYDLLTDIISEMLTIYSLVCPCLAFCGGSRGSRPMAGPPAPASPHLELEICR